MSFCHRYYQIVFFFIFCYFTKEFPHTIVAFAYLIPFSVTNNLAEISSLTAAYLLDFKSSSG